MAENVPVVLGHYRLGKTLGIGAFGKVKLAYHISTGQKVAVKILNKDVIKNLDMAEKVRDQCFDKYVFPVKCIFLII